MKHFRLFTLLVTLLVGCGGKGGTNYYVSLDGNDAWSGRLAEPNADHSDGPFATLRRAQEAVRQSIVSGEAVDGPISVFLREGIYPVDSTLDLAVEDSGAESAPIVWSGFEEEKAILTGGRAITGFAPVADGPGSERIPEDRRKKILVTDLRAQGITDFGNFSDDEGPGIEVFVDGYRMQRARYPNKGFLEIAEVPQSGDSVMNEGSFQWQREGIAVGRHFGRFRIDDDRIASWAPSNDIWMHGYYVWDWRDGFQRVASIDKKSHMVYPAPPHHNYGYSKGQRLYFFNVLEELDEPGEWALDFEKGLLYLWPPDEQTEPSVTVSDFDGPAIRLDETSHVRIERLVFDEFRDSAIEIDGGADDRIMGNVIRNIGRMAVNVRGGLAHVIRSNDLTDLGAGGISVDGGDRLTLESGRHVIRNNRIERFGRVQKTNVPGIRLTGVGLTASHNELHDSPDVGIQFFGNDMTLEYNEIHQVARESDDVGAMYIGRDYSMRGNVIRYNYLHHLTKPMNVGVMGVYLDDWTSGVNIYGNVFYKAGRCVFMGGGRRNTVENNLFIGCSPSVFLDARGKVRNTEYFDGRVTTLKDRMDAVNATKPPYSERYPELVTLYDDDPAMPKYNRLKGNVSMEGTWVGLYSGLPLNILDMTGNVIADPVLLQTSKKTAVETEDFDVHRADDDPIVAALRDAGNRVVSEEPGTFNNNTGLFQWTDGAKNPLVGIPYDEIGLVADEFRITVP